MDGTFMKEYKMSEQDGRRELAVMRDLNNSGEISDAIAGVIIEEIEKYQLSIPKMSTKLMQEIALGVERHFANDAQNYINTRLNEQIERYIGLGIDHIAGCSPDEFRNLLKPLIERVQLFFSPPAKHPIVSGEFTLLLVLPPEWLLYRPQLRMLMGEKAELNVIPTVFEVRKHGGVAPNEPYVLVGINAGRGLKDSTIMQADIDIEKFGCTYFSVHQLVQLLLVRPRFLSSQSSALSLQPEVCALGEKCGKGVVKFVDKKNFIDIEYIDEANVRSGVGVGKPYYHKMIT